MVLALLVVLVLVLLLLMLMVVLFWNCVSMVAIVVGAEREEVGDREITTI